MKKRLLNISPFLVTLLLSFTFGVYRILEIFLHRKHTINSITDILYPSLFMFFADTFFFFVWNIPFFITFFVLEYLKKDQRLVVRNIVFIFLNLLVFLLFFVDAQTLAVQNQVFQLELLTAFNIRIITHGFIMLKEYYWFIFLALPPLYLIIRICPIILKKRIISKKLFITLIGLFIISVLSYTPMIWNFRPLIRYHARLLNLELPYNGFAHRAFNFYQKKTNSPLLKCPTTFFNNEDFLKILNNQKISTMKQGEKKLDNVIVIIVESLSHRYIQPQHMPFLHSLTNTGFYNKYHISPIRSTGYSVLSILSNQVNPQLQSPTHSLIHSFSKENYVNLFFFGGTQGTYGFHKHTKDHGIDHYFSKEDYLSQINNKSHIDNTGDIFDQKFMMYSAEKLNSLNQPYLAFILTNQPHYPFDCPGANSSASRNERYLYCLKYIDQSLKLFFSEIKNKNTLFVITGDHPSAAGVPAPPAYFSHHKVPLIFYSPYENLDYYKSKLTTHSDILPSIIDFLNWDYPIPLFKNSAFNSNKNKVFVDLSYIYIKSYLLAEDNYVSEYACLTKKVNTYPKSEFQLSGHNKPIKNNEIKERHTQELKAYIQYTHQFNQQSLN